MEQYYTQEEVAELLKVHIITIRRKIYRGEIPCIRLGKKIIRIKESELNKYLDSISTSKG